ncbi:MAG: hypothetical protein AB8H03_12995 [Saprospiraceae bacterium]
MKEKEELSKLKLKQIDQTFPSTKPIQNIIPVNCPSCKTAPTKDDINIHDKIAKCENCSTVFSFEKDVKDLVALNNEKVEPEIVVRPAGIEKSYFHDELELTMQQPTGGTWIALAIAAVFIAGLVYSVHIKEGIPIYWPAGIFGFGLFFFYKYWNKANEKIYINIDEKYLYTQYRPKNFIRDKSVRTQEIEQLYTKTIASNYYSLYVVLNSPEGQKHERLIQYIDTRNKARYIELELEKYLGIEDRRLPEE